METDKAQRAIQRGAEARQIAAQPVFRDALEAVRAWAMRSFTTAKTAEEAWLARQRVECAEVFSAYIRAAMAHGQAELDELERKRDRGLLRKREADVEFFEKLAGG